MHNVGVETADPHVGMVAVFISYHCDIQLVTAYDMFHDDRGGGEVILGLFLLFRCHVGNHFERLVGVAGHYADGHGCFDALHSVGVRHYDALHILDDVAAGEHFHLVWYLTQNLVGFSCCVGQTDRLGTAHSGHQLFL